MGARLPLTTQRLVVVTGKGGVGRTVVTAALARAAADAGRRVLAVEVGPGRLGPLLGATLGPEPSSIAPRLSAVRVDGETALREFVLDVLRLRVLARRLLESTSFQLLAAAAPGLSEFLLLHRLTGWLDARRLGRVVYDLLLVDAPASGHSLPVLSAPWTLAALAPFGPIAETLREMQRRLRDPATTLVIPVTTPEELAVRETIELHRELVEGLQLPVSPPVVNAVPPRRFGPADAAPLATLEATAPDHPHVVAARFERARRASAMAQVANLRRALKVAPVGLPFLYDGADTPAGVSRLAALLSRASGLAA